MNIFIDLVLKLIPLYLIILVGWLAGKKFNVQRESIAPIIIYFALPLVTFKGIFTSELSLKVLSYSLVFYLLTTAIALLFYYLSKFIFYPGDKEKAGLMVLVSSLVNIGYFGLPLSIMIFGEEILGTVVLMILGLSIHQSSTAFFLAARGKHSFDEAIQKTIRIPTIYASLLAITANYIYNSYFIKLEAQSLIYRALNPIIESGLDVCDKFVGAYVVLGMLMIGLGLAKVKKISFNYKFISIAFVAKFIVFPSIVLFLAWLNNTFLHFYSAEIINLLFLLSLVPIGAGSIILATELKLNTDDVSITVLLSTLFSIIYIPLMTVFSEHYLSWLTN